MNEYHKKKVQSIKRCQNITNSHLKAKELSKNYEGYEG